MQLRYSPKGPGQKGRVWVGNMDLPDESQRLAEGMRELRGASPLGQNRGAFHRALGLGCSGGPWEGLGVPSTFGDILL